jgi:hypothetical protein
MKGLYHMGKLQLSGRKNFKIVPDGVCEMDAAG